MALSGSTRRKASGSVQLLLSLGILCVIGFIGTLAYTKFDLTAEKRHSLTPATLGLLENLDDQVFVRCYLTGNLPSGFKRLEQNILERLAEFADYSEGMVEYEFIDPYESEDTETQARVEDALYEQGLRFTRVTFEENGASAAKLVWPAAVISYQGSDYPIQFFKSNAPAPDEGMINSSINNLEYELARNLRLAMRSETPTIAILEGQGELGALSLADLETTLSESYPVKRVTIDGQVDALSEKLDGMKYRVNLYDMLVVAKPDSTFDDKDRFVIDQFVMNGGKVIWMLDALATNMDSLRNNQQAFAMRTELGIYDQLFDYGVRVNRDLILDYQCEEIMLDAGPNGNQRNYDKKRWYYSPVITPADSAIHPILTNVGPIRLQFTGSLDIVGDTVDVKKTALLQTSPLSMELPEPAMVSMGRIAFGLDYFEHNARGSKTTAVLLEGVFGSNFRDRLPKTITDDPHVAFRTSSKPTSQLVIADGDIARNSFTMTGQGPQVVPLGYDRNKGTVYYDNKAFLLNAINYLLDDDALISIRSRSIELRLLDEGKRTSDRRFWQMVNVVLPLLAVVLIGLAIRTFRRRQYA